MDSQDYARLADHSYGRDENGASLDLKSLVGKEAVIGGVRYKVLAYADDRSGYQGAIYQRVDTREIVVAHRGTEFDRQRFADLVKTDGLMVAGRVNDQADNALALTRQALVMAEAFRKRGDPVPAVTVTGHSLGGTLAQISAHYFGLRGETFNAYGAASLNLRNPATGEIYRLPEGGNAVLNHVMGADLVSSASPHYGQVRLYTDQREIDTLERHGFNNRRNGLDFRDEISAGVSTLRSGSHDMHNFLPWDGDHRRDVSVLSNPSSQALAAQYAPMLDKYRSDICFDRAGITLITRSGAGLVEDLRQSLRDPLPAGEPFRREQRHERQGVMRESHAVLDMRDPAHPANSRYQQAYAGVVRIDQSMGRTPDGSSERLAAALAAASPHLSSIDRVGLSPDGSRAFAVEASNGPAEARQRAQVDVATAVQRPVEASTTQWQLACDQLAKSVARQQAQERAHPVMQGPVLG